MSADMNIYSLIYVNNFDTLLIHMSSNLSIITTHASARSYSKI